MPASRKRKPSASKPGQPSLSAAVVPTRRQREDYAQSATEAMRTTDLAAANALMAKLVPNERANALIARAYKSLTLSPLCVDAYAALAEEVRSDDQALDYLNRGIHAGELATAGLEPGQAAFWTHSEGSPTMQARIARAEHMMATAEEQGIADLQSILALDALDRACARYPLLLALLNQDDVHPARTLLDAFPEDHSIDWIYGRLLVGYREEQRTGPAVLALMAAALAVNPYVPDIFAQTLETIDPTPNAPGSPEQAAFYDLVYGARWDDEPGAVAWLVTTAAVARETE